MKLNEQKGNLFELEFKKYVFVHCISADYNMGEGIAVKFNKIFKLETQFRRLELDGISINVGSAWLIGNRVFNLITKSKYYGKPTYQTLQMTLDDMKETCELEGIKRLAMPKIGCGLDRLSWGKVREMIKETFKDTDIEIEVRYLGGRNK